MESMPCRRRSDGHRSAPRRWAAGDAYEPYVAGRWSRLVAREFLAWLALGPDLFAGQRGLRYRRAHQNPGGRTREVIGIDPSEGSTYARDRTPINAAFKTADVRGLAAVGLRGSMRPSPAWCLVDLEPGQRSHRDGGAGQCCTYQPSDRRGASLMRVFWDAVGARPGRRGSSDEGRRFPLGLAGAPAAIDEAGLQYVQVRAIDVPTVFESFAPLPPSACSPRRRLHGAAAGLRRREEDRFSAAGRPDGIRRCAPFAAPRQAGSRKRRSLPRNGAGRCAKAASSRVSPASIGGRRRVDGPKRPGERGRLAASSFASATASFRDRSPRRSD